MAGIGLRNVFSPPIKLEIVDVEKVKGLSNYYVYIIKVLCKDGTTYHIYRRYSQFDDMYNALEKRFPIESGFIKSKDRTLPHLPGKKLLSRSAVREVTEKRFPLLNTYLHNLLALPDKIRYDSIVTGFSLPTSDDSAHSYSGNQAYKTKPIKPDRPLRPPIKPDRPLRPPIEQDRPLRPPIPVKEKPVRPPPVTSPPGHTPNHTRSLMPPKPKPPSGRVSPSIPLPPRPTPPVGKELRGKALYGYTGMHSDELSFQEGDILMLLEQVDGGLWWKASLRGLSGLAPANYIDVVKNPPVVKNLKDHVQESDEWDSSDDDEKRKNGTITYYYNGVAKVVEVNRQEITTPTYITLHRAIQQHLHQHKTVLNYKDSDGDLIQIVDQDDIQLLITDATPPRRHPNTPDHAPWAIYVTALNDNSVYNTTSTR